MSFLLQDMIKVFASIIYFFLSKYHHDLKCEFVFLANDNEMLYLKFVVTKIMLSKSKFLDHTFHG
jgi:hypothetical protein